MKKLLGNIFLFSAGVSAALTAFSETYYFDAQKLSDYGQDIKLSESLSYDKDGTPEYFWYTMDADGNRTYLTELPNFESEGDSFKFWPRDFHARRNIILDVSLSGNEIAIGSNGLYLIASEKDVSLNFDKITGEGYENSFSGEYLTVTAGSIGFNQYGDQVSIGTAARGAIKKLVVTGSWNIRRGGAGNSTFYVTGVENHGIDNPDAIINTLTSSHPEIIKTMLAYGSAALDSINSDSYARIGKMTENAGLLVAGHTQSVGKLTAIFTNDTDEAAVCKGSLHEGHVDANALTYSLKNGGAKLALVMKSATYADDGSFTYKNGAQIFTGDVITFTGGVEMVSGKLLINYSPATLGADVSHGTLKFAQGEGATATFGNANDTVGGKFIFDNIEVDGGGELVVRLDKSGGDIVFDQIQLSAGGIGYAEGGAGTVVIDFGTNTSEYLADLIRESASDGLKLIAYNEGQTSDVSFGAVLDSFEKDGITYNFETFAGSDGLYAAYVAVPEPAEVAAVLGALFLAYAVYRRRG